MILMQMVRVVILESDVIKSHGFFGINPINLWKADMTATFVTIP